MNLFLQFAPAMDICGTWWWWSAIMFLAGLLLGWLLRQLGLFGSEEKVDVAAIEADRDSWHSKATKWETDYQSLKYQFEESQKAEADLRAAVQRCEADKQILQNQIDAGDGDVSGLGIAGGIVSTSDDGPSGYSGLFTEDNLQIIEGVGPKIEGVLKDAGYNTWGDVAAAEASQLKAALDAAGSRFKLADPTSWPRQAQMAVEGRWADLIEYQKFTDAGRETVGDFESDSKFEKMALKKMGFSSMNPNDLKVVEGIGAKIEGLLKDEGINTWSDLSQTSVDRIQEILDAAGSRFRLAKPGTWPQQAALAAAGKWEELQKLQDELQGGV
ncbi:MAG: helix-hairpin-helix domain-containing protein [Bacteroidota bacterium]